MGLLKTNRFAGVIARAAVIGRPEILVEIDDCIPLTVFDVRSGGRFLSVSKEGRCQTAEPK